MKPPGPVTGRTPRSDDGRAPGRTNPGTLPDVVAVVHPHTGELFVDLTTIDNEPLAEVALALRERESECKAMRQHVEAELRDRLVQRKRKVMLAGDLEVRIETANESVWDADELEATLRDLCDRGVLDARECVGVIRHEVTVSRSTATRLLERLSGGAYEAVSRCREWRQKPSAVRIVRSLPLLPPQD